MTNDMQIRLRIAVAYALGYAEGQLFHTWTFLIITVMISFVIDYIWRQHLLKRLPVRLKEITEL